MRRTLALLLAFAFLFTLAPQAHAQKQIVDLRPKWEKGQQIRYRMDLSSAGKTTSGAQAAKPAPGGKAAKPAPRTPSRTPSRTNAKPNPNADPGTDAEPADAGINLEQSMLQSVDLRMKVVDANPEGGAVVHLIYDSLRVTMTSDGKKTEFDSAKPKEKDGNDPMAAALRPIVGATLILTLDRDGNITKVEGGENLLPAGLGGSAADGLANPNTVKETWGPIFTTRRSSGQAAVGDSWTTTDSMGASLIGSFLITTENRLKSHNSGNALVEFKGKITPGPESAGAGTGVQIKDSKHEGTYTWDTRRGQLKELNMTQNVNVEAQLAGTTITSKQDSKTTIKRVN